MGLYARKTGPDPMNAVPDMDTLLRIMEINTGSSDEFVRSLPFSAEDGTAGVENEFQAAVLGKKEDLDLARTIEDSNYYKNMVRRVESGDTSRKKIEALNKYLNQDRDNIWENSWVRFPRRALNSFSNLVFKADLKSDKTRPDSETRTDADHFTLMKGGEEFVRIPVSYLLKLALADIVGSEESLYSFLRIAGEKMMAHFLNDNTSPEIFSFYPAAANGSGSLGKNIARETLIRFLLTQVLVQYAQKKFLLKDHGQEVRVFFSSSPPLRQKELNDCISDSFYRDLFMSPCLSGWTRGQEKHRYMKLCHKVLSRSHINGISKLKEAGIITSNLVVLPNTSNMSLANNGTHISLGSKKLGRLLADPGSGFTPFHEKYLGDLAIKIIEHFLCLFPGAYSASPLRLNFEDFHPEKALGFLPHEIDYTHLRMIWRRWKKKADIRVLGSPVTPFGPAWLDRIISRVFLLRGDFIPDARLIDYFVSVMSTDQSPSLDGRPGNGDQLKKDLAQMGVFDEDMPLYQLVRLREFSKMGYTGFEYRYYSMFESILSDMGGAADLQNLLTALSFQYILSGKVGPHMIPDTPDVESERRQVFFCSALNIPTFYVKTRTRNVFFLSILSRIPKTRQSRRYPGYTRVRVRDYKQALIETIKADGRDLIRVMGLEDTLSGLEARLFSSSASACGRLVGGIMETSRKKDPMKLRGEVFNQRAEAYFIDGLRKKQTAEAFSVLQEEYEKMDHGAGSGDPALRAALDLILKGRDLSAFLESIRQPCLNDTLDLEDIRKLIFLMILYTDRQARHPE
ncbi:MAG: hypothetical protein M0T82_00870 [Desulfobacteraceae bacterium]|nr:hypothetical protein [Desulfobacteraceae bacterium]